MHPLFILSRHITNHCHCRVCFVVATKLASEHEISLTSVSALLSLFVVVSHNPHIQTTMPRVHLLQTSSRPRLGVLVVQSSLTSKPGSQNMVSGRSRGIHTPKSTKQTSISVNAWKNPYMLDPDVRVLLSGGHDMQQCDGVTSSHQGEILD